ncbi:diguanylate cyclase [Haladaptatus sp. R4]|uniref:ring-cleaving dioxygenase n=1 Tax=Haladaptatus sp. R4 TaxID=1679489 RepID=UPI0007B4E42E|nr:ring-cleaving dioxygenase [Haladaptatus sp. R4]KZN26457.1 diguanylate cyclase [Haladaptatus sp. R4]
MSESTPGLHHVSAIAGAPQENAAFYTDILGFRLVKQTVSFDDKFMYHLYYGDDSGSPGSLITFFPYQRGTEGRIGQPQPSSTAFTIPIRAAQYWYDRLDSRGVDVEESSERFGETVLKFRDQDGQPLEVVEHDTDLPPVTESIPSEYALRGLHSVTLLSASVFHTAATLEVLGFSLIDQEGDRVRYRAPGSSATIVDLLDVEASYGREGIGTVHHVAFRTGERTLSEWHDRLMDAGLEPTWIKDRRYFESVYFREPGGILFEIATDDPGFTVDEDRSNLGTSLQLPPQYEPDREMITQQLPKLTVSEARSTNDLK